MEAYLVISLINGKTEHFKFDKEKCKDVDTSVGMTEEGVFNFTILPVINKQNAILTITNEYFDIRFKNNISFPCRNIISCWMEWA